jgi:hypothetical protein
MQQQQGGGVLQDFSNVDPSTYMSPMDLYDSIFWGEYMEPMPMWSRWDSSSWNDGGQR